jgi:tripartite-type tricarboxylate transporter receptor subunit TctC
VQFEIAGPASMIPAVGDFVPGYEASQFYGLAAPKNTPAEIVDKVNKEINASLAHAKIKARLADLGGMALSGSARLGRCPQSGAVHSH